MNVMPPAVTQEPETEVLRRKWRDAEGRASNMERAYREGKERSNRLHAALDTVLTWLYRREHWRGLSAEGRFTEAAPSDTWADRKYAELGLNGIAYQPPERVEPEPGFVPPEAVAADAGQTETAQSPGGTNETPDEEVPDVPPGVAAVPEVGRAAHLSAFRSERKQLIVQGTDMVDRLWKQTIEGQLESRKAGYQKRADRWIAEVNRHKQKWWSGLGILDAAREKAWEMTQKPTPAPGPPWRAALARRIDRELEWLKAHDAREGAD